MQSLQSTLVPLAQKLSRSKTFKGNSYIQSAQAYALSEYIKSKGDLESTQDAEMNDAPKPSSPVDVEMEEIWFTVI